MNYIKFKVYNINQIGGYKILDLVNLIQNSSDEKGPLEIHSNKGKKTKYFPMYTSIEEAVSASPTKGCHLVIPGLLPANGSSWKYQNEKQIFYMPNDIKPHFHGDATHHNANFDINKVFKLSTKMFDSVKDKKLEEYRQNLKLFNLGKSNQPIETWIHWRIPYNEKEYPKIIVKKNSIIWWDFNSNHHNLVLVNQNQYENNLFTKDNIKISEGNKSMEIIVTIMDLIGTYYFACTIPGHASVGHKIIIEVID